MANSSRAVEFDATITVSGGAGSAYITLPTHNGCKIRSVCIDAPNESAQYSYAILDYSGYAIGGKSGMIGDTTLSCDYPIRRTVQLLIQSASVDGTYSVRLWTESTL